MMLAGARINHSTDAPFDEAWSLDLIERSLDRCDSIDGVPRQFAAMSQTGDWRERLADLAMPCAIIHGRVDRLILPEASYELSRRIPGSELHIYPHMAHEISRSLWDEFAAILDRTAGRRRALPGE